MRKRVLALGLCAAMAMGTMAGCSPSKGTTETQKEETAAAGQDGASTEAGKTEAKNDLEGSLVFAIWDNNLMDYIDENDMVGKFQEKYPNAEIEVEKIKDDSEYWNAMEGHSLTFRASGLAFDASVLSYTAEELESATHREELPLPRYTVVNILGAMRGVGGDDSWGAPVHPEYCISGEKELITEFIIEGRS